MVVALKEQLTKLLVESNLVTKEDLEKALAVHRQRGGRLSNVLIKEGYLTEEELMLALSQGLAIPHISLAKIKINPELTKLIPKEIAYSHQIFPVSLFSRTLTLAMADPLDVFALDDVKALTGFEICPVIVTSKEIRDAVEKHYIIPTQTALDNLSNGNALKTEFKLVTTQENKSVFSESSVVEEAPLVKLVDLLLKEAVGLKASDLLIEPFETRMRVRYRIDGILREMPAPHYALHHAVVTRLKVLAELNISERRLPQDGRFKIRWKDKEVDFRISTLPSIFGEKVALRVLNKSQVSLDIDKTGFNEGELTRIKAECRRPHGMILVCGPTGSGKTTTLYSILKYLDDPRKNIVTVEDPVEYQLEGINQVTARPEIGLGFADALRSILRQDPDIVMVGEIRDFETADIAIKAALTGHLVLSTIHTTTACGAVVRLVNMGVEPFLITSSIIMVVAQRLVRKLCPGCKEPQQLNDTTLARLGIPAEGLKFYAGRGCPACSGLGYLGRIVLGEVLVLSPSIRELIMKQGSERAIKSAARMEGFKSLREDGLEKAAAGIVSLEEVFHASAEDNP